MQYNPAVNNMLNKRPKFCFTRHSIGPLKSTHRTRRDTISAKESNNFPKTWDLYFVMGLRSHDRGNFDANLKQAHHFKLSSNYHTKLKSQQLRRHQSTIDNEASFVRTPPPDHHLRSDGCGCYCISSTQLHLPSQCLCSNDHEESGYCFCFGQCFKLYDYAHDLSAD